MTEHSGGTPRDIIQVREAHSFITREIIRNPLGKGADGTPLMFHYLVIRDALDHYLAMRKNLAQTTEVKVPDPCANCEGSGVVSEDVARGGTLVYVPCQECEGSGKKTQSPP